jgi:DNA-binding NarL/FixJ family response regulator
MMDRKAIAYEDDPALRSQLESVFLCYSVMNTSLSPLFPNPVKILKELNKYQPEVVLMDLQMLEDDDGLVALHKNQTNCTSYQSVGADHV